MARPMWPRPTESRNVGPSAWRSYETVRRSPQKVVGLELFWDHAEALEAAGLSE